MFLKLRGVVNKYPESLQIVSHVKFLVSFTKETDLTSAGVEMCYTGEVFERGEVSALALRLAT